MTYTPTYTGTYTAPFPRAPHTTPTRPTRFTTKALVTTYTATYTTYTRTPLHVSPPLYRGGERGEGSQNQRLETTMTTGGAS